MLPKGFVYLNDPRMIFTLSYGTDQNFLGRVVEDYLAPVCILTEAAAIALTEVQNALEKMHPNYRLKIFDAYRPTTASQDFLRWAKDRNNQKMKMLYYPTFEKPMLFKEGYIAEKSSHSKGSTVNLTITMVNPNHKDQELDMGTRFDFFGELSHTANPNISSDAKKNRNLLKTLMEEHGFENYHLEWWHYTLKNEPFPDTFFNFPVK